MKTIIDSDTGERHPIEDRHFTDITEEMDCFAFTLFCYPVPNQAVSEQLTFIGPMSRTRREWVESLPEQGDDDIIVHDAGTDSVVLEEQQYLLNRAAELHKMRDIINHASDFSSDGDEF